MEVMNAEIQDKDGQKIVHKKIDFKMVTFSLGGKDYGIDIMRVKEISKVDLYTYVPNTMPYVLGVHNLRGDIIPIIDMRKMFHIPHKKSKSGELLNVIILRLDEYKIGIVVDSIDKVVGIASETIQPPPPLFGDINIQYINGVVDYNDKLYIILDVEEIFEEKEAETYEHQVSKIIEKQEQVERAHGSAHEFNFIVETLATFKNFFVSDTNRDWVERRYDAWRAMKAAGGEDFQLKSEKDADEYLAPFYSSFTGRFLGDEFRDRLMKLLPDRTDGPFNVWVTGCARGHEAYSVASILRLKYPRSILKVWANDTDLLSVSTAPSLFFKEVEVPPYIKENGFVEEGSSGFHFSKEIKDLIYFEFHDTLNKNVMPKVDLVVARDIIAFQTVSNQKRMIGELKDKLKKGGYIIIGDNESLDDSAFSWVEIEGINVYKKEN